MQAILEFLNQTMNKPELYGSFSQSWFQYLSLIAVFIGMVIAVTRMKNLDDKRLNTVLRTFSIVLLVFEVYKQIIFSYQASWSYQWYAFPFQFCSTPMYIALAASFIKQKTIREAMLAFLGTFGLFAGLAVVLYPSTVFVQTIGINIQTMVHHGGMAVIGVGLLAHHIKLTYQSVLKAAAVFLSLMIIAIILNTLHNNFINNGTFNMFFINERFENGIPVLMIFQPLVPHGIFLLIYLFGFTLVASIVFYIRVLLSLNISSKKAVTIEG